MREFARGARSCREPIILRHERKSQSTAGIRRRYKGAANRLRSGALGSHRKGPTTSAYTSRAPTVARGAVDRISGEPEFGSAVERSPRATPSQVPQSLTRVNIQPSAEAEADEAAAWYEAQQPGLGIEFILELDAAIERAAETPLAYERIFREVRRVLLRRFPYAVYFIFEREFIEVFAVLHQQRAPSRWQSRVHQ